MGMEWQTGGLAKAKKGMANACAKEIWTRVLEIKEMALEWTCYV